MRPWRPGDQDAFTPRADFAAERAMVDWDWAAGAPGPTWTVARWSGEIVGVGGGVAQGDGRFDVWAWLAADISLGDWPRLLWLAGKAIDRLVLLHRPRRLQALARADLAPAIDCLRRLSFRVEDAAQSPAAGYQLMTRWT